MKKYQWFTREVNPHAMNIYEVKDGLPAPEPAAKLNSTLTTMVEEMLSEVAARTKDDAIYTLAKNAILAGLVNQLNKRIPDARHR